MQLSTVLSDAALGLSALAAIALARRRALAVGGFALMAAAAAVGCLRYGPFPALQPAHQALSFAAAAIGMPLVLAGFARLSRRHAAIVATTLLIAAASTWPSPLARTLAAVLSLAGWLALLLFAGLPTRERRLVAVGIAATSIAAVFMAVGDTRGLRAIDGLHGALAVAQLAFGSAIAARAGTSIGKPPPTQVGQGESTCGSTAGTARSSR